MPSTSKLEHVESYCDYSACRRKYSPKRRKDKIKPPSWPLTIAKMQYMHLLPSDAEPLAAVVDAADARLLRTVIGAEVHVLRSLFPPTVHTIYASGRTLSSYRQKTNGITFRESCIKDSACLVL